MPKVIGFLFALATLFCIGLGLYFIQEQIVLSQVGIETSGTVVNIVQTSGRNNEAQYKPQVEFITVKGETIRFVSSFSTNFHIYQIGDVVPVLYNPQQPSKAAINTYFQRWGGVMIPWFIAVVFAMLILYPYRKNRRQQQLLGYLKTAGLQIEGTVIAINNTKNYRLTTHHTKVIVCEGKHPVTGLLSRYESQILFFDPKDFNCPSQFPIYIDRQDEKIYVVDCSALTSQVKGIWYQ